jgi:hypothetical protein
MNRHFVRHALWSIALLHGALAGRAAEFAVLSPDNWDEFVPRGKEVDAIYGDFVLRNELIVAVIAQPLPTRNANMTIRGVGGCLIDFTERQAQNDQLSAYYPAGGKYQIISPAKARLSIDGRQVSPLPASVTKGASFVLEFEAEAAEGKPNLTIRYVLKHDAADLLVETIYRNTTDKPVADELSDAIRADRTFLFGVDAQSHCCWADDEWFRQAYGIVTDGLEMKVSGQRPALVQFVKDGTNKLTLGLGESHTIARRIFPASTLLAVRGRASQLAGASVGKTAIRVADPGPVAQARVALTRDGNPYASGRTPGDGTVEFLLPAGQYGVEIVGIDGRRQSVEIAGGSDQIKAVQLSQPSFVMATIRDASGGPIPAKVSFTGKEGTKDPDWGPDSGEIAVKNVYYTHNGTFRQVIAPGKYDVIVSYGPEHDAVFTTLDVPAGGVAELKATLKRTVDTSGWVSADFHSHSSPSGDNTSSQLGRVLNLLCEHVEFAPCTEHNRIDTYVPHLKRLGVERVMATCTGMELTGSVLPVNHQNAFPLEHKPRTQDGGGPVTDIDPVVQVERLALWDSRSDKLVQMNHPNLPQILGDRNEDGVPDAGFERMFGFVDVIEIHPPQNIFQKPRKLESGRLERNGIFHWMQMLNLGYRLPGVSNTDSHYNYHESGFYRNFIKSTTDDPAKIDVMEMVRSSEAGNVIVSTGPFMTVTAESSASSGQAAPALPGSTLPAKDGRMQLHVRVQCPNWFDINRVQVFQNGRAASELNFTRRTTPGRFGDETIKFDAQIPVELKTDAHLIVAAIGEGLQLGPVMGPTHWKLPPVAVSNPIFVDVGEAGFQPNGDLLDVPLAIEPNRPISKPAAK